MGRLFQRWRGGGGWLLCGAVLLAAQVKILTYVTGQDPLTYTRLANKLLEGNFGSAAWHQVSLSIAPGYPALLAGVISVLGPYAVAWVNFVLLLAAFALVHALCKRWDLPDRGAAVVGLCVLGLVFQGYPYNAHFLLYAYRGAPQFLGTVWAMILVATADPGSRRGGIRLSWATLILLAGATLRETTLLAWPGLLAYVLLQAEWQGQRARAVLWLAAPGLVVLAAAVGLMMLGVISGNIQARTWLAFLGRNGAEIYAGRLWASAQGLYVANGWPAAALFLLGVWRCRRRPERLVLMLVPALLLVLFYAVFMVNPRYLLDSYLLVAVVAGLGAWQLVESLANRAPRNVRAWLPAGAIVGLLIWNAVVIAGLPMRGPRVWPAHLRDFVATIAAQGGGHADVLAEPEDRCLTEALMVYARRQPLGRVTAAEDVLRDPPLLYLHPEFPRQGRARPGLDLAESIKRHANLTPVLDAEGNARRVRLGTLRYAVYQATPWADLRVNEALALAHAGGGLLWLDFRQSDPEAKRRIQRVDRDGNVLQSWTLARGNGLIPLALADGALPQNGERLITKSSAPLPRSLLARPVRLAGGSYFTLAAGRRTSVMDWVGPSASLGLPEEKWGAAFVDQVAFELPRPVGWTTGVYAALFILEPRPMGEEEVVFRYGIGGRILTAFTNRLDRERLYHEVRIDPSEAEEPLRIGLEASGPGLADTYFRLVYIGGRMVAEEP